MSAPIQVLAEDPETGELAEKTVQPGDFLILAVRPLYLDGVVRYANGTVVLTLKRAS